MRIIFVLVVVIGLLIIGMITLFEPETRVFLLLVTMPLITIGFYGMVQTKHSLRRNSFHCLAADAG